MHSDGFANGGPITEDPFLIHEACQDLVVMLRDQTDLTKIDRVIGPAMGAIIIAHATAFSINQLRAATDHDFCLSAFTEKDEKDGRKTMALKRTQLRPGELFLSVEDTLTSGKSVGLTVAAGEEAGGIALPFILALVNRSGLKEVNGKQIIALIDQHMPKWKPEDCPLCKMGSEAIRPKERDNWAALNADY